MARGHVSGADWWEQVSVCSPNQVCMCICCQILVWCAHEQVDLSSRLGDVLGGGCVLIFKETHHCGVPVEVLHVCNEHPAAPAREWLEWGMNKRGQDPIRGVRQQRSCAGAWGIRSCVCARELEECHVCCVTPPASARPEGGKNVAVHVCVWCESYMWLLLKSEPCLWLPV